MLTLLAMRALVTATAVAVLQVASGGLASAAASSCGQFDWETGEYVACAGAADDNSPKTEPADTDGSRAATSPEHDSCYYVDLESPAADDPVWSLFLPAGADPNDYVLEDQRCEVIGKPGRIIAVPKDDASPPLDPKLVAQQAIARLPIPLPHINLGPDAQQVAVNVPLWLWVSNPDPVTASATDRTVTVTATAALASVTWSMGEPGAADVTCAGGGQAPWAGADLWAPPCGYTYRLRSLDERTNGTGAWPVTAAATWAITWTASTGESGSDSVTTRSMAPVRVGEWRTVIVAGS